MRRFFLVVFLLLFFAAVAAAWIFLGSGTGFSTNRSYLYISSKAVTKNAVLDSLRKNHIIKNEMAFNFLADRLHYWEKIKPGKYEIKKGMGLLSIVRMLRNGRQSEVKLTIKHIRTKEDLARMTGNNFEFDSVEMMQFLNNADSLKRFEVNPEQALTLVFPDTYTFYWNTTPARVLRKFADVAAGFWTKPRQEKAKKLGLTPTEVQILASIVEEETNNNAEKGNIASVYMNRLAKGMPLQADPTIKFAMKDFTLRRIYEKYLMVESPYNTYRNKGLPPGPICTPSRKTIDAVLDAPRTDYLFFVANPAFDGTHVFSSSYEEHLKKAKAYQDALNKRDSAQTGATLTP
jgi:UPF0755 protein